MPVRVLDGQVIEVDGGVVVIDGQVIDFGTEEGAAVKSIHHILNQTKASDMMKIFSIFAVAAIFKKKSVDNPNLSRREFINPLKWLRL